MADYILVSGTTKTIKSNTGGSRYVVESGGVLVISSGGTLQWSESTDHYILYGGMVIVSSGGMACGGEYFDRGYCVVYAGGIASSVQIGGSSFLDVSSGGKVYNASASAGGIIDVNNSGFAYMTTVSSGGELRVDHYASKTYVYSQGFVYVGSGATLIDTHLFGSSFLQVSSGGTAVSTFIYYGEKGSAEIYGTAYYNDISSGKMSIMKGGYANTTQVCSGGSVTVYSGATATSNLINNLGSLYVAKDGSVSKTTIYAGGTACISGIASGTEMSAGELTLYGSSYEGKYYAGVVSIGAGGYSYNEVFSNARTYVLSGASASGVVYGGTVGSGCSVIVSGGRFGGKTVSNAMFDVMGGNADVSGVNGAKAWISGGVFFASGGGVMSSATVMPLGSAMGKMYVFSGTTATKVNISPNGHLGIMIGGSVTSAVAMPNSGGSGSATIGVSSGGKLGYATVSGGNLEVGSGGSVTVAYFSMGALGVVNGTIVSAEVGSGCPLQVSSGGSVGIATISSGGRINLNQGKLGSVYVEKGGILSVNSGGSTGSGNVYGSAVVSYGGSATGLRLNSGAYLTVSGNGVAGGCIVYSGGKAAVDSGGSFMKGTVSQGGSVTMYNGAVALSCTISSGGEMNILSGALYNNFKVLNGGKVTRNYDCYGITFSSGGIADIDIRYYGGGNTKAVVNNLYYARNKGVVFTLTVSTTQSNGTYILADNASGFNETISVVTGSGKTLGTLTVGQVVNINGVGYQLNESSGVLSVTVGAAVPGSAKSDIDGNGISDVLFQYTGGNYQLGFWMNGTNEWKGNGLQHPAEWDVLGCYDMNSNGKADAVLFGNVTSEAGIHGAYIGYYADSDDYDANWVNIGYLNNVDNIDWKNKVGNLTGNSGKNSIVWYTYELGALGVWTDGTESWVQVGSGFDATWTLIGCGDFSGDGKDQIVMAHNGADYYAIGIDGAWTNLGASDSGWEVRAIGDFKGDGKDDIVAFHKETGIVAMWGDGLSSNWSQLGQLNANDWFVVGAGDYNADAKDDLLVRQISTGMLGYYTSGDMAQWNVLGYGVDMSWTVIA